MQQNDLATRLGIVVHGFVDGALDDFVGSNPWLPVAGIDAQTDHDVAELLCPNRRLDFLRRIGFGVSEIWRVEKNRGYAAGRCCTNPRVALLPSTATPP